MAVGSDAEIFVFDYTRYRAEVAPALVHLLRTGEPVSWLEQVFQATTPMGGDGPGATWPRLAARLADAPTDLVRHCTWLGDDLRHTGTEPGDPSTLTCPSRTCPERGHCLFHQERHAVEDLNLLHEALVATRCLGLSQFLGRTITPHFHQPALDRLGVPAGDRVRQLLAALGSRGAVVGYQFCGIDGIQGWLTVEETVDLAGRLDGLSLPRFPATFAAMAERQRGSAGCTRQSWQDLSLSFVRTVSAIAAEDGQAVLWGNDVCPTVWAERFAVTRA